MDLSKYNVEKQAEIGATLTLTDPVNEEDILQDNGEPVTITVLGTDSKIWRNKNLANQRKRIASMVKRKSRNIDYTVSDEESCEMLAACTTGWSGIVVDGDEVEFSYENAYDLYMGFIWIREQVEQFTGDRANFFPSA